MRHQSVSKTKLLFLISRDFGELSNAVSFVQGYEFSSIFLLPQRLFKVNQDSLPGLIHSYSSIENIIQIIEQENPDIIFLFSGYLYVINQIFSLETLVELINYLKNKAHKVVTSDPFLGALFQITNLTFSEENPYQQLFIRHFSQVSSILANIPHFYPIPFNLPPGRKSFSFFNQNLIIQHEQLKTYNQQLAKWMNINPNKKRWLFILSSEDYVAQINIYGQARFDQILLEKLQQTIQCGRQPVLLAPGKCIEAILNLQPKIEEAILLAFCNHHQFTTLLLEAEYLFLWNIFSNCLIARIGNHLPVFFFAAGHMALAIPAVFKLGMKHNYNNAQLVYLDQTKQLTIEELKQLIPQQEQAFDEARNIFFSSPSPEIAAQQILDSD